ncbi:hypothetical protein L1987_18116 [Smallanthus sonchifolius]|uniref:Uncharacterized protein n=1 Tax=Smallanthus sonchifolius TaxID=185202 RepID=A0ACB9IZP7_9ASTR|nr:hypothetical protein L1987_18116 [Smallanthus sonchifolius]
MYTRARGRLNFSSFQQLQTLAKASFSRGSRPASLSPSHVSSSSSSSPPTPLSPHHDPEQCHTPIDGGLYVGADAVVQ